MPRGTRGAVSTPGKIRPPLKYREPAVFPQPGKPRGWMGEDGGGWVGCEHPSSAAGNGHEHPLPPACHRGAARVPGPCLPAALPAQLTGLERCAGLGSVPWGWGLAGYPSLWGDAPSGGVLWHSGHPWVLCRGMLQPSSPAASARRSGALSLHPPADFHETGRAECFCSLLSAHCN